MSKSYPELLESLLVMEYGKTEERAQALVRENTAVVLEGIKLGPMSLRAVALHLDHIDISGKGA